MNLYNNSFYSTVQLGSLGREGPQHTLALCCTVWHFSPLCYTTIHISALKNASFPQNSLHSTHFNTSFSSTPYSYPTFPNHKPLLPYNIPPHTATPPFPPLHGFSPPCTSQCPHYPTPTPPYTVPPHTTQHYITLPTPLLNTYAPAEYFSARIAILTTMSSLSAD